MISGFQTTKILSYIISLTVKISEFTKNLKRILPRVGFATTTSQLQMYLENSVSSNENYIKEKHSYCKPQCWGELNYIYYTI